MKINALLPTVQKADAPYRGASGFLGQPLVFFFFFSAEALEFQKDPNKIRKDQRSHRGEKSWALQIKLGDYNPIKLYASILTLADKKHEDVVDQLGACREVTSKQR